MGPIFSPHASRGEACILPPPTHGVNLWCLSTARRCALAGYTQAEAFTALTEAAAGRLRAGRELSPQEVERAILTAWGTPHATGASSRVKPLPSAEIARLCPPLSEAEAQAFIATSPLSRDVPSADSLSALYDPNEFVGLKVTNQSRAYRCRVADLPAFFAATREPIQFVTSSPITGRLGETQDGKLSYVAKECFPAQRFVVVEWDNAPTSAQFARGLFLRQLALRQPAEHRAPLVMVLLSGGKSVHFWFQPLSARAADALKAAAIKLDADPATLRETTLVRCPNQLRDNGQIQSLLWLSPYARPR